MRRAARWQRVRIAAAVLAGAAVVLGAVLAVPGTSQAATAGTKPAQVLLKALPITGGLAIVPAENTLAQRPAAGTALAAEPGTPITLDAGMRFTMAGLVCDPPAASGEVVVRLRTSLDGRSWSRWYEAALEQESDGSAASRSYTEPLWTGAARYVQLSARAEAAGAPVRLANARLVAIDSVPDGNAGAAAGVAARPAAAAAERASVQRAAAGPAPPPIVTRQAWGANESLRASPPSYATVKMAFIHHTASGNDYTKADAPAIVRGIYAYHTKTLGWSDIGYNFLIDRFGTIYEGRYGGVTKGVIGAQVLGFNTGSTGISVIGTYSSEAPPAAALTSLENLLAWKLSLSGLDPRGSVQMTCGSTEKFKAGATVTLPVIAGHRDANYTECPGDQLYAKLPTVRSATSALSKSSVSDPEKWVVTLSLSHSQIKVNDTVTYSGAVKTASGSPGTGTVTIQKRPATGGDWTNWKTATLAAGGTYRLPV
ncbi:MAG TPA: peptidoglycan recognition protein, partial [Thermoleophilia bacterium]